MFVSLRISGRPLSLEETQGTGAAIVSTIPDLDHEVGVIETLARQGAVSVVPFHQVFLELPPGGTYYLEGLSPGRSNEVVDRLKNSLSAEGVRAEVAALESAFPPGIGSTALTDSARDVGYALLGLACVLLVYHAVVALLRHLNDSGKTVVLVTHDPVVAGACNRTIELGTARR